LSQLAERLVDQARGDGVALTGDGGLLPQLIARVLETSLEVEMTDHLGYERHSSAGNNTGNSRNGTFPKTVVTEVGEVDLRVPRDRNGTFDPQLARHGERRVDGLAGQVISLYAQGLTTGEIRDHLQDVYDTSISKDTISRITDTVLADMEAWQSRPLDSLYAVVLIDAIVVKVRDTKVANRPVYVAIGVNLDGDRDVLGLWMGPSGGEGAKQWMTMLTELKNRGVADVLITCCDGLKGLPDAVRAIWPDTTVQTSLVHDEQARNGFGCHPHRRERTSADRPDRSGHRPVPPVGDGLRTAIRSRAASAETSDGGGLSRRMSRPRRRTSYGNLCRHRLGRSPSPGRSR
jgi:transposase-like protein